MKKKLFIGLTSAVALAAAAIITVSAVNATGTPESDLLAKNLEAMSEDEFSGRKQSLVDSGSDCKISLEIGPGQYIYQDGDYYHCVDDSGGNTGCRNACVVKY